MSKGTPSMGKKNKRNHLMCPRCGKMSYHKQKRSCAACAYPEAKKRTPRSLKAYRFKLGKKKYMKKEMKNNKNEHKMHPILQGMF